MTSSRSIGPREKLLSQPASSLTDHELLQAIIGSGTKSSSLQRISRRVLRLLRRHALTYESLIATNGLGSAGAAKLVAAFELASRYSSGESFLDMTPPLRAVGLCRDLHAKNGGVAALITATSSGEYIAQHTVRVYSHSHEYTAQTILLKTIRDEATRLYVAIFSDSLTEVSGILELCRYLYRASTFLGLRLTSFQLVTLDDAEELL